ncbi:hypothetical protein O6P43_009909 [Quillaja saponaria]|uniref:Uncharacterized protein n=1 Tax=Quillaja saponaria TaxID=32244 RepID=A0AAD7VDM2_QUISA|nr:hypothetical protein O6P43_009909 [Quillaja saponaria]
MASINGVMGVQWLPEINVTPKAPPIVTNISMQTIGMVTYVKPPTPTGSKEFLVMQKQKEESLGIERLHGGEIVRVELQELGKGHMSINEGSANKNVNVGMLEESGFTGLVKAGIGIEEVKKTKDAQNLIPERSYDVNWKSGVRNGQEWLGINVIPETPNLMLNVGGCYKDKSEWAKVKYARDYILARRKLKRK